MLWHLYIYFKKLNSHLWKLSSTLTNVNQSLRMVNSLLGSHKFSLQPILLNYVKLFHTQLLPSKAYLSQLLSFSNFFYNYMFLFLFQNPMGTEEIL